MKVWICKYRFSGRFGYYLDIDCVVVAEIKSKALGMALMTYPNSEPGYWDAEEVPIVVEGVHHVNEREG